MAQEFELTDYISKHGLKATETNCDDTEQSGRRLLRIGILTVGVLCIIQTTLNVSLRLAFYSKEETDQFLFNISMIAEVCKIDQSEQDSTQLCSCCNNLLRRLLREYKALETERDLLHKVIEMTRHKTREDDYYGESGSGSLGDFFYL